MGDFWKCQTFAASPAEPGDLPWWVSDGGIRIEQPLRCGAEGLGWKLPLIERKAPFLKNKALLTTTIDCTDIESRELGG